MAAIEQNGGQPLRHSIAVELGEREFAIIEAGYRRARVWKTRFLSDLYGPLQVELQKISGFSLDEKTLFEDLARLQPTIALVLVDLVDVVIELLITYSSALEEEREYIEANASDRQIIAAFWEVLRLANPLPAGLFGRLAGLARTGTLPSWPSPNWDLDLTKATSTASAK